MSSEWFKDWFASKDYLDVYSHRDSSDADNLLNLILNNLKLENNTRILDAACGAGRHSIKLAEKGFKITAFDLSESLLEIAKNEAKNKNLQIDFINSDLRKFETNKKFDVVLSLFTSFGYFDTDEENFLFIKKAYNFLIKDGYYIIDFFNSEYVRNNLVSFSVKVINDKEIIEKRSIEKERVVKKIKIIGENREQNYVESVKLYSYNELVSNFKKIGFNEIQTFGNYSGEKFDQASSKRCIIFFQK